jgi:uncharacterized membrane protein
LIRIKSWFTSNLPALTIAAIVAGVVLRISGIAASPLWYDEAFSLYLTRLPIIQMVQVAGLDFNPPLWELTAWPFVRILGGTEFALRLPALLFSLAAIWLAWKLTKEFNFSPVQTLAAMVLIALMPYELWMAQDGRCYAMLTALFLASVYFAWKQRYLGLLACCGLLLYTHSTGVFYAAIAVTIGYVRSLGVTKPVTDKAAQSRLVTLLKNKNILAGMGAALSFVPWLPNYINASSLTFWSSPLSLSGFIYGLLASWWAGTMNYNPFLLLFLILYTLCVLSASVFTLETIQDHTIRTSPLPILALAAIGPLTLMLIVSMAFKNITFYRSLSPMVIPFCLWFAGTVTPRRVTKTTLIIPSLWIILILAGLVAWSTTQKGGDLREKAQFISSQMQPGDVIYHATGTSALPFDYYMPDQNNLSYILDERQTVSLLNPDFQPAFGLHPAALESIPHQRAWIIWARDPIETPAAIKRMTGYTQGAILIGKVLGWQFSDIEIYLKEN